MSFSSSSGYDLSTITWSPEGRVYQVEYAMKHVESESTASIGLVCNDGVILANRVEIIHNTIKLPSPTFNLIHAIEENVFLSFCGMRSDGFCLVGRAREEASNFRERFGHNLDAKYLSNRLAQYISTFTEYYQLRPFGVNIFIASYDSKMGTQLYSINAAGECHGYFACAEGNKKQQNRNELEKLIVNTESVEKNTYQLIKILTKSQDENNSKKIEIEMCFISNNSLKVTRVPNEIIKELEKRAKENIKQEDSINNSHF